MAQVEVLRITHVIDGLAIGGAEMMLFRLLGSTDRDRYRPEVVSLGDMGVLGSEIQSLGIPVRALGLQPHLRHAPKVARLVWWLARDQPDLVQTWLYESDLLGGLTARLADRKVPLVWNVQQSHLDPATCKRRRIWAARACARLSERLPDRIICCSSVSARIHQELGYAAQKLVVIPNGTDVDRFAPDADARLSVRAELGLGEGTPLVGLMARYDPQKDHETFLRAAGLVARRFPATHFLLCGLDVDQRNDQLRKWIQREDLSSRCHLLGVRRDMARLTSALDVATSSSAWGEAFSLALAEAMACGVPCVVTDVGDSPYMVADTGRVVAPRAAGELADALCGLLGIDHPERTALGLAARARVEQHFGLPAIVDRYEDVYREVHAARGPSVP